MTNNDTRETMIRCAAALIGTRGVAGASFSDVLAESGAPRGSIYHYFPDGKRQLTEEAVRWTSDQILGYLATGPLDSPRAVIEHFVDLGVARLSLLTAQQDARSLVSRSIPTRTNP